MNNEYRFEDAVEDVFAIVEEHTTTDAASMVDDHLNGRDQSLAFLERSGLDAQAAWNTCLATAASEALPALNDELNRPDHTQQDLARVLANCIALGAAAGHHYARQTLPPPAA